MKERIETALKNLQGLPFQNIGNSSGVTWISYGEPRETTSKYGGKKIVGDYSMNIQCAWGLYKDGELIVSSEDIRIRGIMKSIEDIKMKIFVERVKADPLGRVHIWFSNNYALTISPDIDLACDEYWRFFVPGNTISHFVVTPRGIED